MPTYYNENDPRAAAWLHELIRAQLIPAGDIDERSIADVSSSDLAGYTACHFFAGIGGWPLALQLAGWPEDRPVWTGSCPCQPFSVAGKRRGAKDARHLWPEFERLINAGQPPTILGEQVASKLGREWLAGIRADLEAMGYEVGGADLCAAGLAAPHIRQRLFWVAQSKRAQRRPDRSRDERNGSDARRDEETSWSGACGENVRMANTESGGQRADGRPSGSAGHFDQRDQIGGLGDTQSSQRQIPEIQRQNLPQPRRSSRARRLADGPGVGSEAGVSGSHAREERNPTEFNHRGADRIVRLGHPASSDECRPGQPDPLDGRQGPDRGPGVWSDSDWLPCRDGKTRRAQSGVCPLADGLPGRVGLLRGYGNAIVPQVAAAFIRAFLALKGNP